MSLGVLQWYWLIAGLLLMAAEMLLPGIFLLWLGAAAVMMAVVVTAVPDMPLHLQMTVYAVLALVAVLVALRYRKKLTSRSDQPLLNERSTRLIGQKFLLAEPIVGGQGRVSIADSSWSVRGPDAPKGTKVTIVAVEGATLVVEKAL